ncbi:hypothetical protein RUM44_003366 [Polyplax serrata]|uniref:Uncharacterized protein n=1 Tax=Polyplax serrata TaxID=468196 RepID=A0ABR1AGA8_POLSC
MTAHINEHGQLVNEQGQIINEHGQILTEDGQPLVVDETVGTGLTLYSVSFTEGDVIVKGEKSDEEGYSDKKQEVHYVQIRLPDDGSTEQRTWFNIVENNQVENTG